jgi:hypothetical protein
MPAPAFKLSLGWKRWKAWDEQDPSKKVTKPGRRKKTKVLKGAAKTFAARKRDDAETPLPTPRTGTRANPVPISPQESPQSPPRRQHQQTSSRRKRNSSRVTRSTAPRKSRRASREIDRYDPNPITNYSYHHKSIATRKANARKKEDEYTKKMRDLAASNKEYKILYYNKLHDYYVLKQESQIADR